MALRQRIETATTAILTLCALVVTGMTVHDRLALKVPRDGALEAVRQHNWREFAVGDMRIGSPTAPVTITEFSDFQCPVCGRFYRAVESLRSRYGDNALALVYRNYPLDHLHPARSAAVAAECAAQQGRFEEYYKALFEQQAVLERLQWSNIAQQVGVSDTIAFKRCLSDPAIMAKIKADSLAAASLEIPGTPLVLVNGWMYRGAPDQKTLDSVVAYELAEAGGQ